MRPVLAMVSDAEITVLWVTYVSAEPADDGGMYMYSDLLAARTCRQRAAVRAPRAPPSFRCASDSRTVLCGVCGSWRAYVRRGRMVAVDTCVFVCVIAAL